MNEEGIRKAANKVMLYTNDDFIAKFDDNKDLPEEIMLQLLQIDTAHHEIEIFDFLVKWYDYQTNNLGKSLQLTQKLFQSVRYSLIIPQLLTTKVLPRSDLINKQLLLDAYHYNIYNSCKPLGEYHSSECTLEPAGLKLRKPKCSQEIQWSSNQATLQHDKLNEYKVSFYSSDTNVMASFIKVKILLPILHIWHIKPDSKMAQGKIECFISWSYVWQCFNCDKEFLHYSFICMPS